jgi:hypothetical protein
MGTTANHALPYPEGTDLVISGDDAIQALAEAVDATLDWDSALVIGRVNAGVATGGNVVFPGIIHTAVDFTIDGSGVITYTGASSRNFLVDGEVETQAAAAISVDSSVSLFVTGSEIAGSYDRVDASTGGTVTRHVVHRITTPVRLDPGNALLFTSGGTAGNLGQTGVRIYPIGPA